MGLSDDQRAMLRLLAQRGEQGYEDIAALKGLSVDEVRAQVAEALAQLDEEGALAATPPPAPKPEAPKVTPEPAPAAPKPPPEAAPVPPPRSPPKAKKSRSPRRGAPKLSAPRGSGLRAAIAAGVAVVALIAIVLIVSGGGDDESTAGSGATTAESTTGTSENTANDAASNPNGVTKAVLKPVDGSDAKGVAIFGKVDQGKKESLALEVAIEGLEPSATGTSYTIWLSQSPQRMLPLVSTPVNKTGKIAGQFEVPVEVLAYLANETFKDLVVTKTADATLEAALKTATNKEEAPAYTGTEVLRGTVTGPVVGAANR